MLIDARSMPDGARLQTDVCVIGAGAAGITLARELANTKINVCLLEGGGLTFEDSSQSLYSGESVGIPYFDLRLVRLRYFGGTTNHWGGWCRPLDPIDFEARPGLPYSGWPIGRPDLDPYYQRAHAVCQVGPYDYEVGPWEKPGYQRLPISEDQLVTEMMRHSPPTRFGTVYKEDIARASNITAYLHANVLELVVTPEASNVSAVRVVTTGGNEFRVEAKVFILATGAIENARLLLASNSVRSKGLGNENDLVGRFFMDHLMVPGAMFLPSDPELSVALYGTPILDGIGGKGFMTIRPEILRKEQLLNIRALMVAGSTQELAMKEAPGILSAALLWKALVAGRAPDNTIEHLSNVIGDLDKIGIYSYRRAYRDPAMPVSLQYQIEQEANPDSRITLSSEKDALGLPRVALDWRFGATETRTLDRINGMFASELGKAGVGRLKVIEKNTDTGWPDGLRGNWHQMGTTRMSINPKAGVVDPVCRVHDIPNLFVAGSSVFCSGGTTNPTLTIVALALRIADRVKEQLR
jgi:choline dehydrogenase-like flavoprotein